MAQRRATVGELGGVPTLYVDGTPIYEPRCVIWPVSPDHAHAPVDHTIISLPCAFGQPSGPLHPAQESVHISYPHALWCGPNLLDITTLYSRLTDIVLYQPDALILLAVDVDAPDWWADLYPNESMLCSNGERGLQSMSSLVWRHQVGGKLRRLVEFVAQGPFARHVVGYYLVSYLTIGCQPDSGLLDYSHPATLGFRRWLHEQYTSDHQLQDAWGRVDVTRDAAEIPQVFMDQDVHSDPQALDALRYQAWATADALTSLCRLVKGVTSHQLLAGTACTDLGLVLVPEAHNYWHELLAQSDAVDFVVGTCPDRDFPTGTTRAELCHGKLFLDATRAVYN